jgi:RNA polymerase sigma factor (sigma-70 family)
VNLRALQAGDVDAWNEVFHWLWPVALAVAQLKLQPHFPREAQDVATEALGELVPKVREVKDVEELRLLAASIAHHRAVSLLHERFANQRSEGKTETLEVVQEANMGDRLGRSSGSPLEALENEELTERLGRTIGELSPPVAAVMMDHFINELSYEEIAHRLRIPVSSVGADLKRGLATVRRIWGHRGGNWKTSARFCDVPSEQP